MLKLTEQLSHEAILSFLDYFVAPKQNVQQQISFRDSRVWENIF